MDLPHLDGLWVQTTALLRGHRRRYPHSWHEEVDLRVELDGQKRLAAIHDRGPASWQHH